MKVIERNTRHKTFAKVAELNFDVMNVPNTETAPMAGDLIIFHEIAEDGKGKTGNYIIGKVSDVMGREDYPELVRDSVIVCFNVVDIIVEGKNGRGL